MNAILITTTSLVGLCASICPAATAQDDRPGRFSPGDPPPHLEQPDDAHAGDAFGRRRSLPAFPLSPHGFPIIQVNVDSNGMNILGDAANEPSISVDPNDRNRIVIGWRQFDTIQSNFREAGNAWTDDGGQTWTFPGVIENGVFHSDPVLNHFANGDVLYCGLSSNFDIDFFNSTNGGQTWSARRRFPGGDKQWAAIDTTGGPGEGHVYAVWSVFAGCCGDRAFSRSINGAQSFQAAIEVPRTPVFGNVTVDSQGRVYLCGGDTSLNNFAIARSSNAQNAGDAVIFDISAAVSLGGTVPFGGGVNPAGIMGTPWIGAHPSNDEVYLLSSVNPPGGDPLDVMFARSDDGGATWSAPIRVNDVRAGYQWFGTMSVAPNGRIDVVWNDTRNDPSNQTSQLFYAFSTDGGFTWSPGIEVSPPYNHSLGYPQQDKLGDYYQTKSFNDVVYVAWAATFNGEQDVYFTKITPPVSTADLISFEVVTGQLLGGDLNALLLSDDTHVRARSGFGVTLADLHKMEMRAVAVTTNPSPLSLDVLVESRIDEPSGTLRISLRNWNTNNFDSVRTAAIGNVDQPELVQDIAAANYVSGIGEVEVEVEHLVFVPFLAFTFESFVDVIEVTVE